MIPRPRQNRHEAPTVPTPKRGARTLLLATAVALAAAGCASFGSYCEDAAACEGGNEADQEACTLRLERDEDRATARACEEDFDAYFECLEDSSECVDGVYDGSACAEEGETIGECFQ